MKTVAQTVIEADRFYTIAAKGGSVIQAVEKATNGGDIRLGKYEHKPEQEWAFVREGDGVYRIRNRASGKLIDLMMTGTANGTWLQRTADLIEPFRVRTFSVADHDHLIGRTGKQTSLRLTLIRRFTYCIKNFEVCTPFFYKSYGNIPN